MSRLRRNPLFPAETVVHTTADQAVHALDAGRDRSGRETLSGVLHILSESGPTVDWRRPVRTLPERAGRGSHQHTRFTGQRRPTLTRTCACGCGEQFRTTFPDKLTVNDTHRKRMSRAKSRPVT